MPISNIFFYHKAAVLWGVQVVERQSRWSAPRSAGRWTVKVCILSHTYIQAHLRWSGWAKELTVLAEQCRQTNKQSCHTCTHTRTHTHLLVYFYLSVFLLLWPWSFSRKWIESETKACPHCKVPTQKNGGCNLVYVFGLFIISMTQVHYIFQNEFLLNILPLSPPLYFFLKKFSWIFFISMLQVSVCVVYILSQMINALQVLLSPHHR